MSKRYALACLLAGTMLAAPAFAQTAPQTGTGTPMNAPGAPAIARRPVLDGHPPAEPRFSQWDQVFQRRRQRRPGHAGETAPCSLS